MKLTLELIGGAAVVYAPPPGLGVGSEERAARAHYDHHYGPGSYDKLPDKTRRRLEFRMKAALAVLRETP